MRLFVTGAAGFIGSEVVAHARSLGHDVVPLVRRPAGLDGEVVADLTEGGFAAALADCDAVIHLATSVDDQGTAATETLLAEMSRHGITRIVVVSSYSVYAFDEQPAGSVIDELTPVEHRPERRDPYTRAKLAEEGLVQRRADLDWRILRLGAVYDRSNLWSGGLAAVVGPLGIAVDRDATQKMLSVASAAGAIVSAATADAPSRHIINVVDSDLPTQRAFEVHARACGADLPRSVGISYRMAHRAARLVDALAWCIRYRVAPPELLNPRRLAARHKSFQYSNQRAREQLGWTPTRGLAEIPET